MEVQEIISNIVNKVKLVKGVSAIVLGGSRARGTNTLNSDIDIGIYYESEKQFDLLGLQKIATEIDDLHRTDTVTKIGEWGKWINGGAWLTVNGMSVDILYRDMKSVEKVMEDCLKGEVTIDYYPGHPFGFISAIYLSEISLCKVLWDPQGLIHNMKKSTIPYPITLKKTLMDKFIWEASFSLNSARKGLGKKDIYYIAGCCFRSISCLNQALFAINECFWLNEKGALDITNSFSIVPQNYSDRVSRIFSLISEDREKLTKVINLLHELIQETEKIIASYTVE